MCIRDRGRGSGVPILHKVAWAESYLHTKWHLDPCSHLTATDMGQKTFGGGGAGSPSKTMRPGPRPTCMPNFMLIRPTVWPQYTNIRDRTDRTDRTDNGLIAQGEPFYKRSPKKIAQHAMSDVRLCCAIMSRDRIRAIKSQVWPCGVGVKLRSGKQVFKVNRMHTFATQWRTRRLDLTVSACPGSRSPIAWLPQRRRPTNEYVKARTARGTT